jgi:hypothetical protein
MVVGSDLIPAQPECSAVQCPRGGRWIGQNRACRAAMQFSVQWTAAGRQGSSSSCARYCRQLGKRHCGQAGAEQCSAVQSSVITPWQMFGASQERGAGDVRPVEGDGGGRSELRGKPLITTGGICSRTGGGHGDRLAMEWNSSSGLLSARFDRATSPAVDWHMHLLVV